MKKQISFSTLGQRADVGPITVRRMLPNRYADAVGPFVFLDYLPATKHAAAHVKRGAIGAHPHRGIATLTYILNGEGEHFDSRGNYAKVYSGGAQWMKAGDGIVHDESFDPDSNTTDNITHGFQFWINLPGKNKAEAPQYISVQAGDVPKQTFSEGRGWLKVIVGEYEGLSSVIPNYSKQYLYHIHLEAGKHFSIATEKGLEYAAFIVGNNVLINDTVAEAGEFIEFDREGGDIEMSNTTDKAVDIILFGGERYTEPIVAEGPFVMNTAMEIANAYRDFHAGKYGKIDYNNKH